MTDQDYVYEVYKARSFSIASKKLFLSQPALSTAIKKIENELGITIFDRSTQPITLTEEGKVYIEAIEKMKEVNDDMITKLADMTEYKTGHVSVAGENFVSSFIIPKVLLKFYDKYPGINFSLEESNSPDLFKSVLNGDVDLMIAHDFDEKLFSSIPIFDETMLLAVPEKLDINKKLKEYALTKEDMENERYNDEDCPSVSLSEFKTENFILLKKGNDSRTRSDRLFLEEGFDPNVILSLDQLITAYNMVRSGVGIAFVTDMVIKSIKEHDCCFYKIKSKYNHRTMRIGYKKGKYLSKACHAFIETCLNVYSK